MSARPGSQPPDSSENPDPAGDRERELSETARRILAGDPVDWPLLESGSTADSRATLAGLRGLEQIAAFHRAWRDDSSPTSQAPPESWASLQVLEEIGRGAFGHVYRARDSGLERDVALKLLAPEVAAASGVGRAFIEEGRRLAKLRHRNIVSVYRAEQYGGRLGLEMELIEGRTLADIVAAEGPFASDEAALIGRDISRALAAVHKTGLVHRDVKAQNVMRETGGRVVLMDFGAGRAVASVGTSGAEGTPLYVAPELLAGEVPTTRSDLYGLGVLLYHLVTGSFPVAANTLDELRAAHQSRTRTRLRDARPDLPDPFVRLIERALDPDPAERPESAGVFEAELSTVLGQSEKTARRTRSARPAMVVVALAVVWAMAASAWALWPRTGSTPTVPPAATRSLAVLPLASRGGTADDEDLADGMTDELISSLGKVPSLRVTGRTSAFTFKDQVAQAREVGQRLGVAMFLEGTVRRTGSNVRVTVSLVSAPDGFQRWSETFESDTGDVFAVQDQITRTVVEWLALDLRDSALQASRAGRTHDPEAQALYLRGLTAVHRLTESDLRRALSLYELALKRDPDFALAYAGIAQAHALLADVYEPANLAYLAAKTAALAAIARDDLVADAHAVLAYAGFALDWNGAAATREYRRALEIDPDSLLAQGYYGTHLCGFGQVEEGRQLLLRATEQDPLSPFAAWMVEWCEHMVQSPLGVLESHKRTEAVAPGFWYLDSLVGAAYRDLGNHDASLREYEAAGRRLQGAPQFGLGLLYVRMGRRDEARLIAEQLDELAKTQYVPLLHRAVLRAALGDMDAGVALFRQSFDARELLVVGLRRTAQLNDLLADPRARRIMDEAEALMMRDR